MAVEYSKEGKGGNVNSEPTETTRLLGDDDTDGSMASRLHDRIKRTKKEFFTVS